MAIRITSPVPIARTLRLRLGLATHRTQLAIEQRRRLLSIDRDGRLAPPPGQFRQRWREDLARTQALYGEFERRYTDLIELICDAANIGIEPGMEEAYRTQREWFQSNYRRVKRFVQPHLTADPTDRWNRRSCDGFEALFLPPGLAPMLAADQGNLIGRLMRTQYALADWERDIKRQASILRLHEPQSP